MGTYTIGRSLWSYSGRPWQTHPDMKTTRPIFRQSVQSFYVCLPFWMVVICAICVDQYFDYFPWKHLSSKSMPYLFLSLICFLSASGSSTPMMFIIRQKYQLWKVGLNFQCQAFLNLVQKQHNTEVLALQGDVTHGAHQRLEPGCHAPCLCMAWGKLLAVRWDNNTHPAGCRRG